MSVSAGATQSIEAIAAAGQGPKWLQLFVYRDRALTEQFVERALASDYHALCLTVDAPVSGYRERDIRNGFTLNPRPTLRTTLDTLRHIAWWVRMVRSPRISLPNFQKKGQADFVSVAAYASSVLSSEVTLDDVRWLRDLWSGPLVIKGVTTPEDAKRLVDLGADGIQVSNHGGRQFDGLPGALEMLPAVVTAVGDRVPVFLDGGIRRGTDVLKAIALGATACFVGRAHLWGLAIGGSEGVIQALKVLQREIDRAMAYGGWQSLAEVKNNGVASYPPLPSERLR
jgi:isopentenyl diphosphate isomerase/L-lactate dehydrogenase-like FMN-dependent dehydrogenase